jgi:hypothetical protein
MTVRVLRCRLVQPLELLLELITRLPFLSYQSLILSSRKVKANLHSRISQVQHLADWIAPQRPQNSLVSYPRTEGQNLEYWLMQLVKIRWRHAL